MDWGFSAANLKIPERFDGLEALELDVQIGEISTSLQFLKRVYTELSALELPDADKGLLFHFAISQMAVRAGVSYVLRPIEFAIGRALPEAESIEVQVSDGISLSLNLKEVSEDEQEPISLRLLNYVEAKVKEEIPSQHWRRAYAKSLQKLEEVLESPDGLMPLVQDLEFFLSQRDRMQIDWQYESVEQKAYKPLLEFDPIVMPAELEAPSCGPCFVLERLARIEDELKRGFMQMPLQDFELGYHYISFTQRVIVDYDHAPYGSRQFKLSKTLEPHEDLDRMPLTWGKIPVGFSSTDIPTSTEEFRDALFNQLNLVYMQKMFNKVIHLYGMDFEPGYATGLSNFDPHFQTEVKPYYEEIKEDRFRSMDVEFIRVELPIPSDFDDEILKEYFTMAWDEQRHKIADEATAVAMPILEQTESMERAKAAMFEALEDELRPQATVELAEAILASWGMNDSVVLEELPIAEGTFVSLEKKLEEQYSEKMSSKMLGIIRDYRQSIAVGREMLFPIASYIDRAARGGEGSLVLVLLKDLNEGDLLSLYDAQLTLIDWQNIFVSGFKIVFFFLEMKFAG
jgi:hypothetical protein